jgi:poly(beta-D-mannuronate) lyase
LLLKNFGIRRNTDKGSEDPTGTVSDNLIYFAGGDPNITNVLSGDTPTSYANLGTALNYIGNVYTGTVLGETNLGFSEETGIMATADGEIFIFSGSGSTDKGADMGTYEPTTDAMVGYGIGACFIDYTGNGILDGDCTIEVIESLTVSSLAPLSPDAGSYDVTVNANVSWTALSNDGWISIDTNSGTGNATVSVSVTENTTTNQRIGTVTFTQVAGGDDIVRTLTVTQEGADLTDIYDLINTGTGLPTDKVTVHSFSKENGSKSPPELAIHSLDKDLDTEWAADDGSLVDGVKGDGEYIIYDLGSTHHLDLIQFNTTNKSDAFGIQIWVSTTGTDFSDFSMVLPSTGDLLLTATSTTDFNQYLVDVDAHYVKLVGFGRFDSAGTTRKSAWTAITEIEFYGTSSLSTKENSFSKISIHPVPTKDILNITHLSTSINRISIYNVFGQKVINKKVNANLSNIEVNTSSLSNGMYLIQFSTENNGSMSKAFIVSH